MKNGLVPPLFQNICQKNRHRQLSVESEAIAEHFRSWPTQPLTSRLKKKQPTGFNCSRDFWGVVGAGMGRFLGSDSNSSQPTLFQRHHGDDSSLIFFLLLKFFFVQLFLAANFVFDSEAQQLGFFPEKCFLLFHSWLLLAIICRAVTITGGPLWVRPSNLLNV